MTIATAGSPAPEHLPAHFLFACTAQRLQGFQHAWQAALPGSAAFEAGFNVGEGQRHGGGRNHDGDGANLIGQTGWPRCSLGCLAACKWRCFQREVGLPP